MHSESKDTSEKRKGKTPRRPQFPSEQGTRPLNTQHSHFWLDFLHQRIKSNFLKKYYWGWHQGSAHISKCSTTGLHPLCQSNTQSSRVEIILNNQAQPLQNCYPPPRKENLAQTGVLRDRVLHVLPLSVTTPQYQEVPLPLKQCEVHSLTGQCCYIAKGSRKRFPRTLD